MIIKAVKLYENGFMTQPFALGGEDGVEKFDPAVKYRSSLQNFVIDTGKEVILVDTGLPKEFPGQVPDDKTAIYMGKKMKEHLPFAMAWWHNMCADGVDMFGRGTADKRFGAEKAG